MYKKIERQIKIYTEGTGLVDRYEIVHGTLYVKFKDDADCDFFHKEMRTFYREFINPAGGVNMYLVGDEFAFDFVPEESESPVFSDKDYSGKEGMMPDDIDNGIWSEFAEEGLAGDFGLDPTDFSAKDLSDIDTMLELENEMVRGK